MSNSKDSCLSFSVSSSKETTGCGCLSSVGGLDGLSSVGGFDGDCSLFAGVYELLEKRRQALPLISADTADFVDIALEGATN